MKSQMMSRNQEPAIIFKGHNKKDFRRKDGTMVGPIQKKKMISSRDVLPSLQQQMLTQTPIKDEKPFYKSGSKHSMSSIGRNLWNLGYHMKDFAHYDPDP